MRSILMMIVVTPLMVFAGCGGSSSGGPGPAPQLTIVSGNWGMSLLPQGNVGIPMAAGGVVNQNGNTFSGIIHLQGSTCFDPLADDLTLSGTLVGVTITLASAPLRGQILSMTLTAPPNPAGSVIALSGSWTLSGGACAATGTEAMVAVPPLSGTWSGPIKNIPSGTVSATLTQTGPDAHGFFHAEGNFTFSGAPCFTAGTVASGIVSGLEADIVLNTNDGAQAAVFIIHNPSPPGEALLTSVTPLGTTCFGNFIQATLNKQ